MGGVGNILKMQVKIFQKIRKGESVMIRNVELKFVSEGKVNYSAINLPSI